MNTVRIGDDELGRFVTDAHGRLAYETYGLKRDPTGSRAYWTRLLHRKRLAVIVGWKPGHRALGSVRQVFLHK